MNILALVTDAFGGSGGIAQYNRDLVTALADRAGANSIVIVPRLDADAALLPSVRQVKARSNQFAYSVAVIAEALSRRPFDFVYCGHLYLAPLAAFVAWFLGIPLWLQVHGWEAWEKPSRIERWAAERAALITAVSRYTRQRFLAVTGVDPARLRVLPNTVQARFVPGPKPHQLIERYGLTGKTILLTVGRLNPDERRKGHDKVIAALPQLLKAFPSLIYVIAGQGDDRARLEAQARSIGVHNATLFTGAVPVDELADLYRLADVFVMPSTQEGFGIVFLEAAASGARVIGGNADGSVDALADGAIGVTVNPENTNQLADAVADILSGKKSPNSTSVQRFALQILRLQYAIS